jgi:RNA polymerase sigma factor (sigma-70 family)
VVAPELSAPFEIEEAMAAEWPRLVRLCSRLSGSPGAAEDLAQETLFEAWRIRHRLYDPRGYSQWLWAIARNVCRRWAREQGRELSRRVEPGAEGDFSLPWLENHLADDLDLEAELDREELGQLLEKAMALLPDATRVVLVERYIEEKPVAEVAERMGISLGAVEMRLQRGKSALKRLLSTDMSGEAAAFGVPARSDDEREETRIWCPRCGQRRLLGNMYRDRGIFTLWCPRCSPRLESHVFMAVNPTLLDGIKGYRAAVSRLMTWGDTFWSDAAAGQLPICPACGQRLKLHHCMHTNEADEVGTQVVLEAICERCDLRNSTLVRSFAQFRPQVREFWKRHPRMRTLPIVQREIEGQAASIVSFEEVTGGARIDVVVANASFRVLKVAQAHRMEVLEVLPEAG